MAGWDGASIRTNISSLRMLSIRLDVPRGDAYDMDKKNSGKSHPAMKVTFIVGSCALLWAAIFGAVAWFF